MFKLKSAFIAVFIFMLASPVFAFVPNDEELAAQVQKHFGALTSWEAEMTFPNHSGVSVHVWYARGKWRQQWQAGDKAVAVGNGGNVVASCTADEFALSPLFVWMVPAPVEAWKSWGVDNATRSYGFCGDQPCLSFGADPFNESLPVVHLNNEDFAPLLIRYQAENGLTSVAFSDYGTTGGFRVPHTIVLTVADQTFEVSVKWIAVNRADSEALYARDSLDGSPCAMPPAPFDLLRTFFHYPVIQ